MLESNYDEDMKAQIKRIIDLSGSVVGHKINQWCYIVKSQESATCPLGWQHVYVDTSICCGLR